MNYTINPEKVVLDILKTSQEPKTNARIREQIKAQFGLQLNATQVRAIIHNLRVSKAPNIVASKNGYYITTDSKIIAENVEALEKRASSILMVAAAMKESISKGRQLKLL